MTASQPLFSHRRLAARHRRAGRIARPDADFLVERAARELADRLAATNRGFRSAADILSPTRSLADTLRTVSAGLDIERVDENALAQKGATRDDLALQPASYDLAVSAFGLHWSNDLPGTLVQIRHSLRPDGLFMAALPGEDTLSELRIALIEAEAALSPGASLRIDPFTRLRDAGALLQRAGFALPVADVEKLVLRYDSVAALIDDLRAMGATSALAGATKPLPKGIWERLETVYAERYSDPDGRIRASFNIVYLTGWAPHESQQKPLRPGSAQVSLTRILNK